MKFFHVKNAIRNSVRVSPIKGVHMYYETDGVRTYTHTRVLQTVKHCSKGHWQNIETANNTKQQTEGGKGIWTECKSLKPSLFRTWYACTNGSRSPCQPLTQEKKANIHTDTHPERIAHTKPVLQHTVFYESEPRLYTHIQTDRGKRKTLIISVQQHPEQRHTKARAAAATHSR